MKILLTARKFRSPFIGGVDVYTDRLARALERLGNDVSFIAFDSAVEIQSDNVSVVTDSHNGNAVWRLRFAVSGRPKEAFDTGYDADMERVLTPILAEERPDLLLVMNFYLATMAMVEAAKSLGIPVAHVATDFLPICRRATLVRWDGSSCTTGEGIKSCASCFVSHRSLGRLASNVMGKLPENRLVQWANEGQPYSLPNPMAVLNPYWKQVAVMERRLRILGPLREKIDLVLAPTQYTREKFIAGGFAPEQVHLLPFAVEEDHPLASLQHVPAEHTRFLFVGRLQPYKGAHLLIEAFNSLQTSNGTTLTVYGIADGYDDYFADLQAAMDLNDRIFFKGPIAPDDLGEAFARADYFVLPSTWHENSPLILLDALQSRVPVIASDVGGVRDVVQHEVNGLLFAMGEKDALRQQLQRAIDYPALAEQLRAGVDLPTIDEYAQTLLNLCRL